MDAPSQSQEEVNYVLIFDVFSRFLQTFTFLENYLLFWCISIDVITLNIAISIFVYTIFITDHSVIISCMHAFIHSFIHSFIQLELILIITFFHLEEHKFMVTKEIF